MATTKTRSKSSSSGVAARRCSPVSRATTGRRSGTGTMLTGRVCRRVSRVEPGSPGPAGRARGRPRPATSARRARRARSDPVCARPGSGTTTVACPGATTRGARVRLPADGRRHVDQGGARRCGQPRLDDERRGGVVDDNAVGVLAGDGGLHDAARPARARSPRTGVIPSGRGSVTTMGAVVSLGPRLVTMTEKVALPRVWSVRSLSTTSFESASTTAGRCRRCSSGRGPRPAIRRRRC